MQSINEILAQELGQKLEYVENVVHHIFYIFQFLSQFLGQDFVDGLHETKLL